MAGGTINGSVANRGESYSYYINWQAESDIASNSSLVRAWAYIACYAHSSNQNNCGQNLYINGVHFTSNKNISLSSGVTVELIYGETRVYHNNDGSKSINISANGTLPYGSGWGPSSGSASGDVWLDTIPRYADFNGHRINATALESVEVAYNSSKDLNAVEYSLNGGSWKTLQQNCYVKSGTWNAANNTVIYCVTNLEPNTNYTIETRIAHTQGVWKNSGKIYFKTNDIARIVNNLNSDFGQDVDIRFSNLANGTTKLTVKIANIEICTRENLTSNYTLSFTKEELSEMVKLLKEETTEITYIVTTNNKYTATTKAIITLKSNIYIKRDGEWKKAKLYKKNSNWKLTKIFYKFNGAWRNTK